MAWEMPGDVEAYLLWSDRRDSGGGLFAFVYGSRSEAQRAKELVAPDAKIDAVTVLMSGRLNV